MLKQKHAPLAKSTPRTPMAVPTARPAPLQPHVNPVQSRLDPRLYGIRTQNTFETLVTNRAGPLDLVHKARGLAPQRPPVPALPRPKSPGLEQTPPDSILKPLQRQSNQASSTGGIDFTKASVEPNDIFPRQRIELLERQLNAKERMLNKRKHELDKRRRQLAQDVRAYRLERGSRRKASGPCRPSCPGKWPSRPTDSGAGSFSRVSQCANDASQGSISALTSSDPHLDEASYGSIGDSSLRRGIARPDRHARARISTPARYGKERISKRANVRFQPKMLQQFDTFLKFTDPAWTKHLLLRSSR